MIRRRPLALFLSALAVFALGLFLFSAELAAKEDESNSKDSDDDMDPVQRKELPVGGAASVRQDTLFCFAASGPGAWGSAGTDVRGFTFDDAGGPADAGFTSVDETAQPSALWHLANNSIVAGHDTDMGPTAGDFSLWCGLEGTCGWIGADGYGNGWDQYALIENCAFTSTLDVDFLYCGDFEGGNATTSRCSSRWTLATASLWRRSTATRSAARSSPRSSPSASRAPTSRPVPCSETWSFASAPTAAAPTRTAATRLTSAQHGSTTSL